MTEKGKINKCLTIHTYHINLKDEESALETLLNVCVHVHLREFGVNTWYYIIWLRFVLICLFMSIDSVSFTVFSGIFRPHEDDGVQYSIDEVYRTSPVGFRSFLKRTSPAMLSPQFKGPVLPCYRLKGPVLPCYRLKGPVLPCYPS